VSFAVACWVRSSGTTRGAEAFSEPAVLDFCTSDLAATALASLAASLDGFAGSALVLAVAAVLDAGCEAGVVSAVSLPRSPTDRDSLLRKLSPDDEDDDEVVAVVVEAVAVVVEAVVAATAVSGARGGLT